MESCRYEAMLTGVRHQAGEIDNLVSQWEQYFAGNSPNSPDPGKAGGNHRRIQLGFHGEPE